MNNDFFMNVIAKAKAEKDRQDSLYESAKKLFEHGDNNVQEEQDKTKADK